LGDYYERIAGSNLETILDTGRRKEQKGFLGYAPICDVIDSSSPPIPNPYFPQ
jgi:hypothetical protein